MVSLNLGSSDKFKRCPRRVLSPTLRRALLGFPQPERPLAQIPTGPTLYAINLPEEITVGKEVEITIGISGFKDNKDVADFWIKISPKGKSESKKRYDSIDPNANGGRQVTVWFKLLKVGLITVEAALFYGKKILVCQTIGTVRVLGFRN
ncbi:MAG: hypothetical protein M1834_000794 [Cirrosporium novae-zelandiae]|nr:MAG: hypothetical protein M1834_000794 [Cirrosporium novae-zelandiae]